MRPDGHRNLSRPDAERLLDTRTGRSDALSALLASAAAPPTAAQQCPGEDAALTAFRRVRLIPPPHPRRQTVLKATLVHLLATKFATAAAFAATAATGGVALAAVTGTLPAPVQNAAHSAFGAPAADPAGAPQRTVGLDAIGSEPSTEPPSSEVPSSEVPSSEVPSSDTPSSEVPSSEVPSSDTPSSDEPSSDEPSSDEPSSDDPSGSDSASETPRGPHPSLTGLCKAFQAHSVDNPGRYLDSSAFTVLVTAAGGKDNVASYCVTLVGAPRSHRHGRPSSDPQPAPSTSSAEAKGRPARPSHAKPSPTKPSHAKPSHSAPSHATPSHAKAGHPKGHPSVSGKRGHPAHA